MTSELTTAKAEFSAVLVADGLKVMDYVPERFIPPVIVIAASGTYLTRSSISSEFIMGLDLMLVSQTATNKQATETLDQLIEDTILALPQYAGLVDVGQPYTLQTNNAEYLAATVRVDLRITI